MAWRKLSRVEPVAQLVEHRTFNAVVAGSSPARLTIPRVRVQWCWAMSANPIPRLTADEYLALDRTAEWKSEFHDGEMFPIEAVSLRHARILVNLIRVADPGL